MTALAVPNLFEALVEQLVQEREVQGLTQRQLAERLQTTQPAVAKLEGGGDLRVSTLLRWAAALGKVVDPILVEAVSGLGDPSGTLVGTVYPDGSPLLLDLFAPLSMNRSPILLVSGDPGSGKSRLLAQLVSQLTASGVSGLVLGRELDASVEAITGSAPARPGSVTAPVKGVVGLEVFTRDLPSPSLPSRYHSAREVAALAAAESAFVSALSGVPQGGFLVVEEAQYVTGPAEAALKTLLRWGRTSGVAVVLAAQSPAALSRWSDYSPRVLALRAHDPVDQHSALELCGLESTRERLREVSALWGSRERYALFCDVDGRTAPVLVGGSSLRT